MVVVEAVGLQWETSVRGDIQYTLHVNFQIDKICTSETGDVPLGFSKILFPLTQQGDGLPLLSVSRVPQGVSTRVTGADDENSI